MTVVVCSWVDPGWRLLLQESHCRYLHDFTGPKVLVQLYGSVNSTACRQVSVSLRQELYSTGMISDMLFGFRLVAILDRSIH